MVLSVINRQHVCFCSGECPCRTKPFLKYRVRTSYVEFPEYFNFKLYDFSLSSGPGHCEWSPVEPEYAPFTEKLIRRKLILPSADHSWEWELQLQNVIPFIRTWVDGPYSWNDPDDCNFTILGAGCEDPSYNLVSTFFPLASARIESIPSYLCTDDQAHAWPVS